MAKHALHVSIIGGLAVASALQRQGIQVTLFERNPELREIGAGLTLWANGVQVLWHLGLADTLLHPGFCWCVLLGVVSAFIACSMGFVWVFNPQTKTYPIKLIVGDGSISIARPTP